MSQTAKEIAVLYDWRSSRGGSTKDYERFAVADIALLVEEIDIRTARFCDAGCGSGVHLQALIAAGAQYPVGVDLSEVSLCTLLERDLGASAILLHADFTTWGVGPVFDAVICSLPPISPSGGQTLEKVVCALRSITRPLGHILLKLFDAERAPSITGTYSVVYDGSETEKVSTISVAPETGSLMISQCCADNPEDVYHEQVAIPTRGDVFREALSQGIEARSIEQAAELPGTRTYLLRVSD